MKITTEYLEKEYDHGEIEVVRRDGCESKLKIELDFTISSEDLNEVHEEIQKTVRKFAI